VIDPASLPAALGAIPGQTVLVTGRVDARLLYVQPASGAERSILLADLFRAAEDAEVNLLVLRAASTPRQPGGRNWWWQKVEVKGLEKAMQHPRLADFLIALVGSNGRMLVSATAAGGRTTIEIKPATEVAGSPQRPGGGLFSGIVSDVTGRVTAVGLEGSVSSAERPLRCADGLSGLMCRWPLWPAPLARLVARFVAAGGNGRLCWPHGLLGRPHGAGNRVPARVPAADCSRCRSAQCAASRVGCSERAGTPVAPADPAKWCDRTRLRDCRHRRCCTKEAK